MAKADDLFGHLFVTSGLFSCRFHVSSHEERFFLLDLVYLLDMGDQVAQLDWT